VILVSPARTETPKYADTIVASSSMPTGPGGEVSRFGCKKEGIEIYSSVVG
jgi:hypothetical protein